MKPCYPYYSMFMIHFKFGKINAIWENLRRTFDVSKLPGIKLQMEPRKGLAKCLEEIIFPSVLQPKMH